jgi:predicted Fe-Mo cluster-binding NifX family protein
MAASTDREETHDRREEWHVKLVVSSSGPGLESDLDPRFGRARYLLVVGLPDRDVVAIDNFRGIEAAQGAGIQAAQIVIDHGAGAVVTGHCGPKAFQALRAAGIDVYHAPGGTVSATLDRFEACVLVRAQAADVMGRM